MNSKVASVIPLPAGARAFVSEESACLPGMCPDGGAGVSGRFSDAVKAVADYIYWETPFEQRLDGYRMGSRRAASNGVTTVKEHSSLQLLAGIRELWARGKLGVPVRMPFPLYPEGGKFDIVAPPEEAEALFKRMGNLSGVGNHMWRFAGIRPQGVGGNILMGGAWTIDPKRRNLPGSRSLDPRWQRGRRRGSPA